MIYILISSTALLAAVVSYLLCECGKELDECLGGVE